MKITFTGKQEKLSPPQERKLATRFAKLSKMLERRGEKDASVVLSTQRHLQHAEVRVNYYDHPLISTGAATDQFTAIAEAVDKLEQQVVKLRAKWRDTQRGPAQRETRTVAAPLPAAAGPAKKAVSKAKSVKAKAPKAMKPNGKPMTAEEAILSMESEQDYMVYQDADSKKVAVLVRRRDGNIDVVEP